MWNPEDKREDFITQFVALNLAKNPLDSQGLAHVWLVQLEVDDRKISLM